MVGRFLKEKANPRLIAIFGSLFRNKVDPARFGVVLTYTLAAASLFANLVSLYAQVEQEMVRSSCRVLDIDSDRAEQCGESAALHKAPLGGATNLVL